MCRDPKHLALSWLAPEATLPLPRPGLWPQEQRVSSRLDPRLPVPTQWEHRVQLLDSWKSCITEFNE